MSDGYCGNETSPGIVDHLFSRGEPLVYKLQMRVNELEAELQCERESQRRRETSAYEHGLGSAAEVHRQNKLLTEMVSALIDPSQRLNMRKP